MATLKLMPKQLEVLKSPATEILYGGAAGGGKSYLARALAIIVCIEVPGIQVYLFRRISKELLSNHINTPDGFPVMLREFIQDKLVSFNRVEMAFDFKNGSRINLCHCQYEADLESYQGASMGLLIVDEATHFTEKMVRFLRSRLRLGGLQIPEKWKGKLPMALYASNPGGVGHNYFLKQFVAHGLDVWKAPPDEGGMLRQFISAKLEDNKILMRSDKDYGDRLRGLGNSTLVSAMLDGDWSQSDSLAIYNFRTKVHVVKPFVIPERWKLKRSYDYGFSAPYSVLWGAISNGESFIDGDGIERIVPKNSMFIFDEMYGATSQGAGLKETAGATAKKIIQREKENGILGYVRSGPADSSIFNVEQGPSIAELMAKEGVRWTRANKRPGSRVNGLAILNQMVDETLKDVPEGPCFFIFDRCASLIVHLSSLGRDEKNPEDVDTHQEDHDYDALRYMILDAWYEPKIQKVVGL